MINTESFFDELEKIAIAINPVFKKYIAQSLGGAAAGAAGGSLVGLPGHRKQRALTGAVAGSLGAPIALGVRDLILREGAFAALNTAAKSQL